MLKQWLWVHLRCLHSWLCMDVPTLQTSVLGEQVLALVPWENTGVITCYFTEFLFLCIGGYEF